MERNIVSKQRITYLIIIMAIVSSVVAFSSIGILYNVSFEQQRLRLLEVVQSRARIIESVARYDAKDHIHDPPGDPFQATLSQITEAHKNFRGFGETGEFTLAELKDDHIFFLLQHRHNDIASGPGENESIKLGVKLAEPMQKVLQGEAGSMVGFDYRGEKVMAAYEPVVWSGRNVGIVAKIDLSEIREPFIKASLITAIIAFITIALGIVVFKKVSNPLINNLEESEGRFRSIFESDMIGTFFWDANGKITDANDAFLKIVGYSREDIFSGKLKWRELTPPEYTKLDNKLLKEVMRDGVITPYEKEYIHKDGSRIPILIGAAILPGETVSGIAFVMDITERKLADKALRDSEKRLNEAQVIAHIGSWDWDLKTDIVIWSDEQYRIFGFEPGEMQITYEVFRKAVYKEDRENVKNAINKALSGEAEYSVEFRINRKDGEERIISAQGLIERGINGIPIRMIGTNIDITARKKSEAALRDREQELRTITDVVPALIAYVDHNEEYRFVNKAYEERWSVSKELLGGKKVRDVVGNKTYKEIQKNIESALSGNCVEFDGKQYFENGDISYFEANYIPDIGNDGKTKGFFAFVNDVTERKQAELKLADYRDELEKLVDERTSDLSRVNESLQLAKVTAEEANQAKSIFLANMSHELRTPLHAILGFSKLMQRDMLLSEDQKENLETINRSGNHLQGLINDVLEVSRIEAGHIELKISPFDLDALLVELNDLFQLRFEQKGLDLKFSKEDDLPRYLLGDEGKLRQVLINLLENAFKFTEQGGVEVRTSMQREADRRLKFSIEDTGRGFDFGETSRLFQPFEQGLNEGAQEGVGLGLAISRKYAQLMGGELTATGETGKGSIFIFTCNVEESTAETMLSKVDAQQVVGLDSGVGPKLILVVDDYSENRRYLSQILQSVGFRVCEAENGEESIKMFESERPDVILMDMRMPVMDGYEATRRIKARHDGTRVLIIAVTASALAEQRDAMLACGAHEVLIKPFNEQELFALLEDLPGMEFVYKDKDKEDVQLEKEVTTDDIAVLSGELRQELREATGSGDVLELRAITEKLEAFNPGLSIGIRKLVERYDYDRLHELLK